MADLSPDFLDLLDAFLAEDVRFLLVGAHAVGVHGAPRATGDIDVWIRSDPKNALFAWRALQRFGAPVQSHGLTADDLASPGTVYQIGLPPFRIDILTRIDGVDFEGAWRRRHVQAVGGRELPYLGLRDLLENKRASGRTKDLLDIELLREAGVDVDQGAGAAASDPRSPGRSTPGS